ncbi:MAG: hypothetical protein KU37_11975 [Sulfuricurvum sp. PC08-66]|nr:MAG: hypothetical protein KU37_11975 [Sulfuricurvum sp. PC08-66]
MEHNHEKLKLHILPLSTSTDFGIASKEWKLVGIGLEEDWDECPCGHRIKELCYIENTFNGGKTYVGNVCVNKFMGIDTGNIIAGLQKIIKNNQANTNDDLIVYAKQQNIISEWEYDFLSDTKHKRNLSDKQLEVKQKINIKIINNVLVKKNPKKPNHGI